jgi:hypothetical protein
MHTTSYIYIYKDDEERERNRERRLRDDRDRFLFFPKFFWWIFVFRFGNQNLVLICK